MEGEKLQMRGNLLSSFAAGILLTTSICGAVYFTDKSDVSNAPAKVVENQTKVTVQPSENEMKTKLASAGYVVQTKAEYDKKMNDAKTSAQKVESTNSNKSQKVVYRVVVSVTNGMTSIDVGHMLQNAHIIKDAFKFSKDIENKKLEKNLRPGSFVVDSSMSYDKIISTIFKKR
jgi:hypothetical protein